MRFAARIDRWIVPVLILVVGFAAAAGGYFLYHQHTMLGLLFIGGVVAGAVILRILVLPVYYVVCDDSLIIRTGLQRERISWEQLKQITTSRNAVPTATAWSLRRLRVVYQHGDHQAVVHIAPVDVNGLLDAIAARSDHHEVEKGQLCHRDDLPALSRSPD